MAQWLVHFALPIYASQLVQHWHYTYAFYTSALLRSVCDRLELWGYGRARVGYGSRVRICHFIRASLLRSVREKIILVEEIEGSAK